SLHPLAVMLALLIGGELFGVTGAILSVPVAAALAVVLEEVRREREARRETGRSAIQSPQDGSAATVPGIVVVQSGTAAAGEPINPDGPLEQRPLEQQPSHATEQQSSRAPTDLATGRGNQSQTDPGAHADHGGGGE
ncbi:MAG TPA: hypothetical protein VGW38_02060, partial [Chloroflexota bacterium]|nr:hypothetical protein [Chloroflexota bacterium]